MSTIKTFKIDKEYLDKLTSNEKKILPILIVAAKKIDSIYRLQENPKYDGGNFYPHDATKEEIEKAAQQDYRILSPFTIVERDNSGKLVAIDYHIKYKKLLEPVVKLLNQAANICENKSLKKYITTLSNALVDGNYQQADVAWLNIRNSNLDLIIGPHERYLDKIFFVKRAYQGVVGIIDKVKSQRAKKIRNILYATIGYRPHRVIPPSIVDIEVLHCLLFSGFLTEIFFSQQHLPSDPDTTERYGSKIIGYLSSLDYKFENLIYPIFNAVFEKKFKARYSKDLLKKGNYYYVLLLGIAQQLHRYRNSRFRLKEIFPVYDEANSMVSGIQHAKHLILKGVIDQRELEAIIIAQICWIFSEWITSKKTKIREDYLKGDTLTLNFLIREGALQEQEGISWPNFAKMFFEMENLSLIFTRFLDEGSYLEAQEFLAKYLSFSPFKAFNKRLAKIKPL